MIHPAIGLFWPLQKPSISSISCLWSQLQLFWVEVLQLYNTGEMKICITSLIYPDTWSHDKLSWATLSSQWSCFPYQTSPVHLLRIHHLYPPPRPQQLWPTTRTYNNRSSRRVGELLFLTRVNSSLDKQALNYLFHKSEKLIFFFWYIMRDEDKLEAVCLWHQYK